MLSCMHTVGLQSETKAGLAPIADENTNPSADAGQPSTEKECNESKEGRERGGERYWYATP